MDFKSYCPECGGYSQSGKTCRDLREEALFTNIVKTDVNYFMKPSVCSYDSDNDDYNYNDYETCDCPDCTKQREYCPDCGEIHEHEISNEDNNEDVPPERNVNDKIEVISPPRIIGLGNTHGAKAISKALRFVPPTRASGDTIIDDIDNKLCPAPKPSLRLTSGGPPEEEKQEITIDDSIFKMPMAPASKQGKMLAKKLREAVYPGNRFHRNCYKKMKGPPVPRNMGWLWNIEEPCGKMKPYKHYRPGAMPYKVAQIIRKSQEERGLQAPVKKKVKSKRGQSDMEEMKPMLEVHKKEGCYLIVMNPIKNPFEEDGPNNKELSPVHIMITRKQQKVLKINDDGSCECLCECLSGTDCNVSDEDDDDESSSNSEFDFEFSPPIALVDPEMVKKKTDIVTRETQYNIQDCPGGKGGKGGKGKKK